MNRQHLLGGSSRHPISTDTTDARPSDLVAIHCIGVGFKTLHGPAKGYLIITGGQPDYRRMIALAGGSAAHIVVIPTAAIRKPNDEKKFAQYCSTLFAEVKCTVLHTTDRELADSPEFVAPLKDAAGVYLEGGRQWRLADAYLGTLTLKEILGVLDRGGVVMGGSAGATIQGSYMVRGSSNPDNNTIMMAPGHEVGFGLITNATINQHVENGLACVRVGQKSGFVDKSGEIAIGASG